MNTDFKTTYVILKLLSFQQNDNELTVPSLSTWLVTQFIENLIWNPSLLREESNLIIINECPHRLIGLYF